MIKVKNTGLKQINGCALTPLQQYERNWFSSVKFNNFSFSLIFTTDFPCENNGYVKREENSRLECDLPVNEWMTASFSLLSSNATSSENPLTILTKVAHTPQVYPSPYPISPYHLSPPDMISFISQFLASCLSLTHEKVCSTGLGSHLPFRTVSQQPECCLVHISVEWTDEEQNWCIPLKGSLPSAAARKAKFSLNKR